MIDSLIGIIIALLPLYIRIEGSLETNRDSKDFLFLYLIIALMIFLNGSMKSKYLRYSVISFISLTLLNQYDPFSSNVISQTIYIIAGLVFFLKYYEHDGERKLQHIYNGMIVGSLIQAIIAILGNFGYNIYPSLVYLAKCRPYLYYSIAKGRWVLEYTIPELVINFKAGVKGHLNVVGSLGNYNLTASYLAITIPAFLSRRYIKYLAIIPIIALILTHSYMGVGALIVGVVYYNKILSKIKMYLLAITGMIIFPFLNLNLDSARFGAWFEILQDAFTYKFDKSIPHWIAGMGPGWFPDSHFIISKTEYFQQEHSVFMSIFNIYGLLGFALLFPIFYKFLHKEKDDRLLSTILFIIFCNSYGHFAFHQSTVMIIIIPIIALNLRESERIKGF